MRVQGSSLGALGLRVVNSGLRFEGDIGLKGPASGISLLSAGIRENQTEHGMDIRVSLSF